MLHLRTIIEKQSAGVGGVGGGGCNPFKMNHKFNDKSQAKENRAVQLQLFEILTPSANHLSE